MTDFLRKHLEDQPLNYGYGKISAFLSISIGLLACLTALCFLFPNLLTMPELRSIYHPAILKVMLFAAICLGLVTGVISIFRNPNRMWGLGGVLVNTCAALLASGQIESNPYQPRNLYAGLDYFILTLLVLALIFIPMERLFAKYQQQKILRKGWVTDLKYFMLSHVGIQLLAFFTIIPAQALFNQWINADLHRLVSSQPITLQFIEILLVVDFFSYWIHRSMHKVPRLWRIHAVHHSSLQMDWLASSRVHVTELVINRFVGYIPLLFLGFSPAATYAYLIFISFHAIFIHANVRFRFPYLRWVIATPEFHHWHHSSEDEALDKNFAAFLPVYDVIFKTAHMPAHLPERYGTTPGTKVPDGFMDQLVYPFKKRKKKKQVSG